MKKISLFLCSCALMGYILFFIRISNVSQHSHFVFLYFGLSFLGIFLGLSTQKTLQTLLARISEFYFSFFSCILFALSMNTAVTVYNILNIDINSTILHFSHYPEALLLAGLFILPAFFVGILLGRICSDNKNSIYHYIGLFLLFFGLGATIEWLFWIIYSTSKHIILWGYFICTVLLGISLLKKKLNFITLFTFLCVTLLFLFIFSQPLFYKYSLPTSKDYIQARKMNAKTFTPLGKYINYHSTVYPCHGNTLTKPFSSPIFRAKAPAQGTLFVNANNPQRIYSFFQLNQQTNQFFSHIPLSILFNLISQPSLCIIHPQGNIDTITSLSHHAHSITLIENNSLIPMILKDILYTYSPLLYHNDSISLTTDAPIPFLLQHSNTFDIIVYPFNYSKHQIQQHTLFFEENFLLTKDALKIAFESLRNNGFLVIRAPIASVSTSSLIQQLFFSTPKTTGFSLHNGFYNTFFIKKGSLSKETKLSISTFSKNKKLQLYFLNSKSFQKTTCSINHPFPFYRHPLSKRLHTALSYKGFYALFLFALFFLVMIIGECIKSLRDNPFLHSIWIYPFLPCIYFFTIFTGNMMQSIFILSLLISFVGLGILSFPLLRKLIPNNNLLKNILGYTVLLQFIILTFLFDLLLHLKCTYSFVVLISFFALFFFVVGAEGACTRSQKPYQHSQLIRYFWYCFSAITTSCVIIFLFGLKWSL